MSDHPQCRRCAHYLNCDISIKLETRILLASRKASTTIGAVAFFLICFHSLLSPSMFEQKYISSRKMRYLPSVSLWMLSRVVQYDGWKGRINRLSEGGCHTTMVEKTTRKEVGNIILKWAQVRIMNTSPKGISCLRLNHCILRVIFLFLNLCIGCKSTTDAEQNYLYNRSRN